VPPPTVLEAVGMEAQWHSHKAQQGIGGGERRLWKRRLLARRVEAAVLANPRARVRWGPEA
jgi:hypothetical protein